MCVCVFSVYVCSSVSKVIPIAKTSRLVTRADHILESCSDVTETLSPLPPLGGVMSRFICAVPLPGPRGT